MAKPTFQERIKEARRWAHQHHAPQLVLDSITTLETIGWMQEHDTFALEVDGRVIELMPKPKQ